MIVATPIVIASVGTLSSPKKSAAASLRVSARGGPGGMPVIVAVTLGERRALGDGLAVHHVHAVDDGQPEGVLQQVPAVHGGVSQSVGGKLRGAAATYGHTQGKDSPRKGGLRKLFAFGGTQSPVSV